MKEIGTRGKRDDDITQVKFSVMVCNMLFSISSDAEQWVTCYLASIWMLNKDKSWHITSFHTGLASNFWCISTNSSENWYPTLLFVSEGSWPRLVTSLPWACHHIFRSLIIPYHVSKNSSRICFFPFIICWCFVLLIRYHITSKKK